MRFNHTLAPLLIVECLEYSLGIAIKEYCH